MNKYGRSNFAAKQFAVTKYLKLLLVVGGAFPTEDLKRKKGCRDEKLIRKTQKGKEFNRTRRRIS